VGTSSSTTARTASSPCGSRSRRSLDKGVYESPAGRSRSPQPSPRRNTAAELMGWVEPVDPLV
jgi:hypothetical protein